MAVNKNYPFILWISTVIIAPLFFPVITCFRYGFTEAAEGFSLLSILIFFGALLSLPTFAIFHFTFEILKKKFQSILLFKMILNIICIASIFLTFKLFFGSIEYFFSGIYSVCVILLSIFFKISYQKRVPN